MNHYSAVITDYMFQIAGTIDLVANQPALFTLTMPPGIVQQSAGIHYVLIAGHHHTEAVLIIDWTPTSIEFIPTNDYAADEWVMASATSGLQEAFFAAPSANLFIPKGNFFLFAKATLYGRDGLSVVLSGIGNVSSRLYRHQSYPSGDLIHYDSTLSAGHIRMQDFSIVNSYGYDNPDGSGIHITCTQPREAEAFNVVVYNGCSPVSVDGTGGAILDRLYVYGQLAYDQHTKGPGITYDCPHGELRNCRVWWDTKPASGCPGLLIKQADGIEISGGLYSGTHGIQINPSPNKPTNFIYASNVLIDETYSHGIYVTPVPSSQFCNQFRFVGIHLATQRGDDRAIGIFVQGRVDGLIVSTCNISGFSGPGIVLGSVNQIPVGAVVANNTINNNRLGIVIPATGVDGQAPYRANTVISGNVIGNSLQTAYGTRTQEVGIYMGGTEGTFNGYTITGNNLTDNNSMAIFKDKGSTIGDLVFDGNSMLPFDFKLISSSDLSNDDATLFYRNIETYGSTPIYNITPAWDGRRLTIVKTDPGTVTVGGSGNIAGGPFTLHQYGKVDLLHYGQLRQWIVG